MIFANVAVTFLEAFIVTTQLPVPVHAPPQPVKIEVAFGVATSVTDVSPMNVVAHVAPQSSPKGMELTVPNPAPALVTVSR